MQAETEKANELWPKSVKTKKPHLRSSSLSTSSSPSLPISSSSPSSSPSLSSPLSSSTLSTLSSSSSSKKRKIDDTQFKDLKPEEVLLLSKTRYTFERWFTGYLYSND